MQGYLFSPPKPAAEIRQLLFAHRERSPAQPLTGHEGADKFRQRVRAKPDKTDKPLRRLHEA
jgi:hypothetical protein